MVKLGINYFDDLVKSGLSFGKRLESALDWLFSIQDKQIGTWPYSEKNLKEIGGWGGTVDGLLGVLWSDKIEEIRSIKTKKAIAFLLIWQAINEDLTGAGIGTTNKKFAFVEATCWFVIVLATFFNKIEIFCSENEGFIIDDELGFGELKCLEDSSFWHQEELVCFFETIKTKEYVKNKSTLVKDNLDKQYVLKSMIKACLFLKDHKLNNNTWNTRIDSKCNSAKNRTEQPGGRLFPTTMAFWALRTLFNMKNSENSGSLQKRIDEFPVEEKRKLEIILHKSFLTQVSKWIQNAQNKSDNGWGFTYKSGNSNPGMTSIVLYVLDNYGLDTEKSVIINGIDYMALPDVRKNWSISREDYTFTKIEKNADKGAADSGGDASQEKRKRLKQEGLGGGSYPSRTRNTSITWGILVFLNAIDKGYVNDQIYSEILIEKIISFLSMQKKEGYFCDKQEYRDVYGVTWITAFSILTLRELTRFDHLNILEIISRHMASVYSYREELDGAHRNLRELRKEQDKLSKAHMGGEEKLFDLVNSFQSQKHSTQKIFSGWIEKWGEIDYANFEIKDDVTRLKEKTRDMRVELDRNREELKMIKDELHKKREGKVSRINLFWTGITAFLTGIGITITVMKLILKII